MNCAALENDIAKLLRTRLGLSGRNYHDSAPERVAAAIMELPKMRTLLRAAQFLKARVGAKEGV